MTDLLRVYPQRKPGSVLRKIRDGRVKILHRWFIPSDRWMEYDGRLDGMVFCFGVYWNAIDDGYQPTPFVSCWGPEQNYREKDAAKWEPDPQVVDGYLPWVWWREEQDD